MNKLNIGHFQEIQDLAEKGYTLTDTARCMGVDRPELERWRRTYDQAGVIQFRKASGKREPRFKRIAGFAVPA